MKKYIGFDFDGTVIADDTFRGFISFYFLKNGMIFRFVFFYVLCVFHKIGLLNNDKYKKLSIDISIAKKNIDEIKYFINLYCEGLVLKPLVIDDARADHVFVTASPVFIVKEILRIKEFPDIDVVGTEIVIQDNYIGTVKVNCYGKEKAVMFQRYTSEKLDCYIGDSKSDLFMKECSCNVVLIGKNDCLQEIYNEQVFYD